MRVKFVGHATVLIEGGKNIVIDPFLNGNPVASLGITDLPRIDYILVTHGHGDHLGDTVEITKKFGSIVVSNFELGLYLQSKGLDRVHTMHIGGTHDFGDIWVKMTPALHGSSVVEDGKIIYAGNPCGFVVKLDGKTLYHPGDTGLTKDMELLRDLEIDLAFIPIGGNYTMDAEDGAKAVKMISPRIVVPIHYNTWPLIEADPEIFCEKVRGFSECRILKPGDSVEL